mgnify:CR=1 FL=1
MISVVSRIFKGELPYINSFLDHYISLEFEKIYLINTIVEEYNTVKEYILPYIESGFVELLTVTNNEVRIDRVIDYFIKDIKEEYFLWCDIDEFLILDVDIYDLYKFIKEHNYTEVIFCWLLSYNDTDISITNDTYKAIKSFRFKSIVKRDCILRLGCHNILEYRKYKIKSVFYYDIDKSYVIHLASRSLKDTLIKSIYGNMNIEIRGTNYTKDSVNKLLNNNELPKKFKLIAFYNELCNSNNEYVVNLNNNLLKIDYSYENKLISDVNYDLLKEIYYKQKFKIYKSIDSRLDKTKMLTPGIIYKIINTL